MQGPAGRWVWKRHKSKSREDLLPPSIAVLARIQPEPPTESAAQQCWRVASQRDAGAAAPLFEIAMHRRDSTLRTALPDSVSR